MSQSAVVLDEIYDIWFVPWWERIGLLNIALAVLLVLVIILLFILRVWFLNREYWYIARKRIKILIDKQRRAVIHARDIYVHLMQIIKYYIEARFGIPATHLTEYELLYYVKIINTERAQELLSSLIIHAESIKFGTVVHDTQVIRDDLAKALLFIELSKPKSAALVKPKKQSA